MERDRAKWLGLGAVFLFAAATFQITDGRLFPGVVFFCAAAVLSALVGINRKKEDLREEQENKASEVTGHVKH